MTSHLLPEFTTDCGSFSRSAVNFILSKHSDVVWWANSCVICLENASETHSIERIVYETFLDTWAVFFVFMSLYGWCHLFLVIFFLRIDLQSLSVLMAAPLSPSSSNISPINFNLHIFFSSACKSPVLIDGALQPSGMRTVYDFKDLFVFFLVFFLHLKRRPRMWNLLYYFRSTPDFIPP